MTREQHLDVARQFGTDVLHFVPPYATPDFITDDSAAEACRSAVIAGHHGRAAQRCEECRMDERAPYCPECEGEGWVRCDSNVE